MMKTGVRDKPDVAALASRDANRLTILAWHYHDDDVAGPDAAVTLSLEGLGLKQGKAKLQHFRIDATHSNAYTAWQRLGSPAAPSPAQYEQLADGKPVDAARRCAGEPGRHRRPGVAAGRAPPPGRLLDRCRVVMRWRIAILVSAAIAISYLDRQTLPVAIKAIERDIPVTNAQFSFLQSSFLIAYAVMYAGGGKLMDVVGTRAGFLAIMLFWSMACASHGLATSVGMLAVSRLLLGMGEGGGFPAATRAVAEWFPVHERSTAMGIVNAGTAVGGVVAPPLLALVVTIADWRAVFYLTAVIGLAWAVLVVARVSAARAPPASRTATSDCCLRRSSGRASRSSRRRAGSPSSGCGRRGDSSLPSS